jgi:chromosome segregation ATPase
MSAEPRGLDEIMAAGRARSGVDAVLDAADRATTTIAPAYRAVDQLSGKIADLERRHAEDVQLCAAANSAARTAQRRLVDAQREIASLKAERSELYRLVDSLRAERDSFRASYYSAAGSR